MKATPVTDAPAMPENLAREAEQLTREIQAMLRASQQSIEEATRLRHENERTLDKLEKQLGCGIK